jgi:predicted nucleotidyltransferase
VEAIEATADAGSLIRRTLSYLGRRIRVQQAILFGSHARGAADQWSDVDLAVVSQD